MADITADKMRHALNDLKRNRAPWEDVLVDMINEERKEVLTKFDDRFNRCQETAEIPDNWNKAILMLLFKKRIYSIPDVQAIHNFELLLINRRRSI